MALGIGKDDEDIFSSNTYIATALAVTYVGARPFLFGLRLKHKIMILRQLKRQSLNTLKP